MKKFTTKFWKNMEKSELLRRNKKQPVSELRMDIVSEDWVIIAQKRGLRPSEFKQRKKARRQTSKKRCVFCNLWKKENGNKITAIFYEGKQILTNHKMSKHWDIIAVKNKFPVVSDKIKGLDEETEGNLYKKINGFGFHEVIVLMSHKKRIGQMEIVKIKETFDVYQQRYLSLMKKTFVRYISVFHNSGPEAGASIEHPHSQIITTPLIDKNLMGALEKSKEYYELRKECIYCKMIKWEQEAKKRIIFENENFIALCPFASKTAFEVIITPKSHFPYFEKINEKEKTDLAEIFQAVFKKLDKVLNNPDFNFYLHTSPCDGKSHEYYHWHWTILPKTSTQAGFEQGTLMDICAVPPEEAALCLRKIKN